MRLTTFLRASVAFGMVSALTACTDIEDHSEWGYDIAPQFTATVSGNEVAATRGVFNVGTTAGIYRMAAGAPLSEAQAQNRGYLVQPHGEMTPLDPSMEVRYAADGAKSDFIAYLPYQSKVLNPTIKFSIAAPQNAATMDFLYAHSARGKMGLDRQVRLRFDHKLVKLLVVSSRREGISSGVFDSIEVVQVPTRVAVALQDGKVSAQGDVQNLRLSRSFSGTPDPDGERYEAFLIPQTSGALTLRVWQGEHVDEVSLEAVPLEGGYKVVVPLQVVGEGDDFEVVAAPAYRGAWYELPGERVSTPANPAGVPVAPALRR